VIHSKPLNIGTVPRIPTTGKRRKQSAKLVSHKRENYEEEGNL
jgi:hypothetical protein